MDKVVDCRKSVLGSTVTYIIRTSDAMRYQVIQNIQAKFYVEAIYLIARGRPHLLRKRSFPLQQNSDFQAFIENSSVSH